MNIDQAIYILRNTAWLGSNDERDETEQAVEMVIDKLLSAEKTQLSGEDATKDATSDLISRQDAIDAIFSEPLYESGMKKRDADAVVPAIYEKIKSLPSAEKAQLSEEDATSVCKCPCEYREPCDVCHYDDYREHGCPAEEGVKFHCDERGIARSWDEVGELVRCKDCKHWIPYDWMFSEVWQSKNMEDYPEDEMGCDCCDMNMGANDYCSRAERRGDSK